MSPRVLISSYFSIDTDLSAPLKCLPEFVSGQGYNVVLASSDGSQRVETNFLPGSEDEFPRLEVRATADTALFQRVLGIVTYALAAHSDDLQIDRRDED